MDLYLAIILYTKSLMNLGTMMKAKKIFQKPPRSFRIRKTAVDLIYVLLPVK